MAEPLSNVDAAWLHMEAPNNLMMITGLFIFDQPLDFERLKVTLEQRFSPFDRFHQRIVEPRFGLGMPPASPMTSPSVRSRGWVRGRVRGWGFRGGDRRRRLLGGRG